MMDINKHIVKNDDNKPFHSNGFAQVASGNRVGSVGNTSFGQRQQIENNRRLVYGYNRSVIGNPCSVSRPKPILNSLTRPVNGSSLQQRNSAPISPPVRRFSEPPARGYNPFA